MPVRPVRSGRARYVTSLDPPSTRQLVDVSKCDGKRPVCSQCQKKGTDCQFDTDDLRRITNLRNLNQRLSEKVTDYEKLVTRLQSGDEDDAVDVLRQLRRAKDFAEGIERLRKEVLDASGSPIDEDRSGFGSPSGFSRDSEPGAGSFRGSTWHPALQIRITGLHQPASADYFGDDASPIASVRQQCRAYVQQPTNSLFLGEIPIEQGQATVYRIKRCV